jgi:peptidoglycan/LPS O-acetylase OafA/YrhL
MSSIVKQPSHLSYRPEIDGLRAIAVLAVLFFHAFPHTLPGGFIGVDVFFVISGYLISTILIGDLDAGKFSYVTFYGRRVRRLLPALITVLTATSLVAWLGLYPEELRAYGEELLYGAGFLGNFAHFNVFGGYFGAHSDQQILLHLWSLGIEEQFYLVWPLVLTLTYRFAKRQLPWVLLAGVAGSLALSGYLSPRNPETSFYLPQLRFWELGLGALLALAQLRGALGYLEQRFRPHAKTAHRAGLATGTSGVGLVLILGAVLWISPDAAFPGLWALIPTAGAFLCLAAGPTAAVNRWILSISILRYVGRVSYPLYLWHWPLLAWVRISGSGGGSTTALLCALGVALVAAELTCRYIETPIRALNVRSARLATLALALLLLALMGAGFHQGLLVGRLNNPGILFLEAARKDWHYPGGGNYMKQGHFTGVETLGTAGRPGIALFIGDSHVEQYWPRIEEVARSGTTPARKAKFISFGNCPPLPGLNRTDEKFKCDEFLAYALGEAQRPEVDTVVFAAYWEAYFMPPYEVTPAHRKDTYSVADATRRPLSLQSPAAVVAFRQFENAIAKLRGQGKRVFIVLSNPTADSLSPTWGFPARSAAVDAVAVAQEAGVLRSKFSTYVSPVTDALALIAAATGAVVLDPLPDLCDGMTCPAQSNGFALYKDDNHLTARGARERAKFMDVTVTGE